MTFEFGDTDESKAFFDRNPSFVPCFEKLMVAGNQCFGRRVQFPMGGRSHILWIKAIGKISASLSEDPRRRRIRRETGQDSNRVREGSTDRHELCRQYEGEFIQRSSLCHQEGGSVRVLIGSAAVTVHGRQNVLASLGQSGSRRAVGETGNKRSGLKQNRTVGRVT
jgi:hypothetical protein